MTTTTSNSVRRKRRMTAWALGALIAGGSIATAGTATAAPGPADPGARDGQHAAAQFLPGARLTLGADVGPVPGGLAGPDTPAIAPDGTEIRGLQDNPWAGLAHRRGDTRGLAAAGGVQAQGSVSVDIVANGARLRSSVPSGRVLAYGYRNSTAYVGCKIPNGGHVWGWMSLHTSGGWRSGWMRGDLWEVRQSTGPGGGGTGSVPWC